MPKIMIIDDDRTMIDLLKTLLEMDGYEVVPAPHQYEPIQAIAAEKPDLILLDVFLEDIDGIDILARVRATPELAGVRIVMTSGMQLSDESAAAGADSFLLKPYTPDELIQTIRRNLEGNSPVTSSSLSNGVS